MYFNTYIIGDIHGNIGQLKACLQAVEFDYENDRLITLGDIVDRGQFSFECVEELLKIRNRIDIQGNHDSCFWESLKGKYANILYNQGGKETLISYAKNCNKSLAEFSLNDMPETHKQFFSNQLSFYVCENNIFTHGGFNKHHSIFEQPEDKVFLWDRDLFGCAYAWEQSNKEISFKYKDKVNEIFIGHTPTIYWNSSIPMKCANIWNLDTGCGKGGKLTIMNLNTKKYWQS